MSSFKLVPITAEHNAENVGRLLFEKEGLYLLPRKYAPSIPHEIMLQIPDRKKRIILLNMDVPLSKIPINIPRESGIFAYAHKNHMGYTELDTDQVFMPGNCLMGFIPSSLLINRDTDAYGTSEKIERFSTMEYRCHLDPDSIEWQTRYSPYVNVNRDSESIGYSSWDGNLVRWFGSGFATRIQYAIASGLFPED